MEFPAKTRRSRGGAGAFTAALLLLLWTCGGEPQEGKPSGEPVSWDGTGPNGGRRNRVLVGEDLTGLPGEAGAFFRRREREREEKRRKQQWLQPADLELGEFQVGAVARGRFRFRNPTGKDQTLSAISSSCACQKLILHMDRRSFEIKKEKFEPIHVPAGMEGELEAFIEVREGERVTTVTMFTSDPENPAVMVRARVLGVREFTLTYQGNVQSSIDLGNLGRTSHRDFELEVKSRDGKPFEITGHEPLPMGLGLEYRREGAASWRIVGRLGPGLSPGGTAGGTVIMKTDRGGGFQFAVNAFVPSPIRISPSSMISFGAIPRQKGESAEFRFELNEPEGRLEVARTEILGLMAGGKPLDASSLGVEVSHAPGGRSATVRLEVPPGLPRGRLKGGIKIHFKGENLEARMVRFMGYVR